MTSWRSLVLVTFLVPGCIKGNPARGMAASGAPLLVRLERGTGVTTTNDVVGSDTVTDSTGSIHAIEIRGDVDHAFQWSDYSYFEGTPQIDEQDFYRLAGDRDSEERVKRGRAGGKKLQWIGLAIMAGAVVLGGGVTALGIAQDSTGLAIGGTIGGLLLISPGAALYGGGRARMTRKIIEPDIAQEAADLIEHCVDGNCAPPSPGGRKYRDGSSDPDATSTTTDETPVAADPPPVARPVRPTPPVATATTKSKTAPRPPLVGTWRGSLTLTMSQKGQTPSTQTDETTFEIEAGTGSVTFWPNVDNKEPRCRFTATPNGTRATFKAQKICTLTEGDTTTTLSVRSGTLEQLGSVLAVKLVLDASIRSKAGTVTGSMTYQGTGAIVP